MYISTGEVLFRSEDLADAGIMEDKEKNLFILKLTLQSEKGLRSINLSGTQEEIKHIWSSLKKILASYERFIEIPQAPSTAKPEQEALKKLYEKSQNVSPLAKS